jgi:hypothetical protein
MAYDPYREWRHHKRDAHAYHNADADITQGIGGNPTQLLGHHRTDETQTYAQGDHHQTNDIFRGNQQ